MRIEQKEILLSIKDMNLSLASDTIVFCVMRRSGTHYTKNFIVALDRLLAEEPYELEDTADIRRFEIKEFMPGIRKNIFLNHFWHLFYRKDGSSNYQDKLSYISETVGRVRFEDWRDMVTGEFAIEGYPKPFQSALSTFGIWGACQHVFVYRNPLDQIASTIEHIKNHKKPRMRDIANDSKIEELIISDYFKHFLGFYWLFKASFPGLKLVRYEDMVRDSFRQFTSIANTLGRDLGNEVDQKLVSIAVDSVSYDKSKIEEIRSGNSLARDQIGVNPTHLRGGEIGKWKNTLSDKNHKLVYDFIDHFEVDHDVFIFE